MLNYFLKIMNFLIGIWSELPPETKEKIIDIILQTFEKVLRDYHQSNKPNSSNEED